LRQAVLNNESRVLVFPSLQARRRAAHPRNLKFLATQLLNKSRFGIILMCETYRERIYEPADYKASYNIDADKGTLKYGIHDLFDSVRSQT
jgi:hypothetical protein